MLERNNLSFVDIETTGTSAYSDRIIEIAILRVENNKLVKKYHSLINPNTYISPYIEAITGINQTEIENAPSFFEIADEVKEVLGDSIFVAHNVRFDYEFIKAEFARLQQRFNSKKLCTVKLSRKFFPSQKRHNLDSVIAAHNIDCEKRHRALSDAEAIWKFYQILLQRFSLEEILTSSYEIIKKPSGPIKINQDKLKNIPTGPGVYIFYGSKEGINGQVPLYIGKSIHLKQRILSHFSQNSNHTDMRLCQETEDLEVIPTAGELGALIREAEMIKKLQPLYNRVLRQKKELTVLLKSHSINMYETAQIMPVKTIEASDTHNVLAIFKSKKQAVSRLRQIIKEYELCPKLFSLEKTNKSCMHHQFGWCKGACINKELAIAYNTRLSQAFSASRIASWPYKGPIVIKEHNPSTEKTENFIVHNWCLLQSSQEDECFENLQSKLIFDLDTYKIIRRFLRRKRKVSIQKITF